MHLLSKKQLDHLRTTAGLLACASLLFFPGGFRFSSGTNLLKAFIAAFIALGMAPSLLKLGKLPRLLWIWVLIPLAFSTPLILAVLPHPLTTLWLLTLFALVVHSLPLRFRSVPKLHFLGAIWIALSLGASQDFHLLYLVENYGLPKLPHRMWFWVSVFAIIPLAIATRPMLRSMARKLALIEFWCLLLLTALYPLLWCAATSFKIPLESERSFHDLTPEPRLFLLPSEGIPNLMPSELRKSPSKNLILFTLNEMTWRLSDLYIASTFSTADSILPEAKVRSMKLYGYLEEDRHGNFLPEASFSKQPPSEMNPDFLPEIQATMEKIVVRPIDFNRLGKWDTENIEAALQELEELNRIRKVPGDEVRYRLTAQARRPFENGLLPRQLLLLNEARVGSPVELIQDDYAPRRQLSTYQILNEFRELEELGAVESRRVWQWNQHVAFFQNPPLWKSTGVLILAGMFALLAGYLLPKQLPKAGETLLVLAALSLTTQIPALHPFQAALRMGMGCWLASVLLPLKKMEVVRLSLFSGCIYISTMVMALPDNADPVHQCAWILVWTVPALLLLALALRPLPRKD